MADSFGHSILTIDNNIKFNPHICKDILNMGYNDLVDLIKDKDIVWLSPPCTTFSLASGNKHWTIDRKPKTQDAIKGREILYLCMKLAYYCDKHNKIFFIENPNGRAVWFLDNTYLKKVWYCQYGDTRAKPSNIWTNLKDWQPKTCSNNNKLCNHIRAKRGFRTGTQGLKNSVERGKIPPALFIEIFTFLESIKFNIKPNPIN